MVEFPTHEEMAKKVAEIALDDFKYQGKTIREWIKIMTEQQLCEDAISRREVLENAFTIYTHECGLLEVVGVATIEMLPSIKSQVHTGHWIMRHRKVNTINYCTGEDVLTGEIHTVKELIRYETDEPYCACCGKRAEDISQDYCGYCGARMQGVENEV